MIRALVLLVGLGLAAENACASSAIKGRAGIEVEGRTSAHEVLDDLATASLHFESTRDATGVSFSTGFATIELSTGSLVPVKTAAGRLVEVVFSGQGSIRLTPVDDIEAGQLELFTGTRALDETFTEAVFVLARDEDARAILARPGVTANPELMKLTEGRYSTWRSGPERRALKAEIGFLLGELGDVEYDQYFAGWLSGNRLGPFALLLDPSESEQVGVGQFVRFDLEGEERRRVSAYLHRRHERGQLLDVEMTDLGRWDSWISSALRDSQGREINGSPGFEPSHYRIDVVIDPRSSTVSSSSRIELTHSAEGRRVLSFVLHRAMEVSRVRSGETNEDLLFQQEGNALYVFLPAPSVRGRLRTIEVEASGQFLVCEDGNSWALRDSLGWYPRRGALDRATYDVTLRWPEAFEIVASGRVVDEGSEGRTRWQHRELLEPTFGFSFEIGDFVVGTAEAGDVTIRVALDGGFDRPQAVRARDEILETAASVLTYFQRIFGPYPLAELTIVSVPRQHSQALLGFVTLSSSMMIDFGAFGPLIGVQDRESVIAHEVAHQWWGHAIGWRSYRDQWISEAMANFSALSWNHEFRPATVVGPVTGWLQELTATLDDGRRIESLGPLVLGERLLSSRSVGAYQAVVYRKGALILGMLARKLGTESFLAALRYLLSEKRGQVISTEDFVSTLESATGTDLGAFARQFLYRTGLPEVYYDYRIDETAEGNWRVSLSASQEAPVRSRYAIVRSPSGKLAVSRSRVKEIDVAASELVVPFRISLVPTTERAERRVLLGEFVVTGAKTAVEFEIAQRPSRIELDPGQEVFGRFFDTRQHPKRIHLTRAEERLAAGDLKGAERILDRGLERRSPLASTDRLLDAHLHLRQAAVLLASDRAAEASESAELARIEFDRARKVLPASEARRFVSALEILRARMDIDAGDYGVALARLRTGVLDPTDPASTEGFLWLAIAAYSAGDLSELAEALKIARKRGADVAPLEAQSSL